MENIINFVEKNRIKIIEKLPKKTVWEIGKKCSIHRPFGNKDQKIEYMRKELKKIWPNQWQYEKLNELLLEFINDHTFSAWKHIPEGLHSKTQWEKDFNRRLIKDAIPICYKYTTEYGKSMTYPLYDESQTELYI